MATTAERDAQIAEMVRRIVAQSDPEKIILFGSCARGDATPDSDVDLLVVMPVAGSRRGKAVEIGGDSTISRSRLTSSSADPRTSPGARTLSARSSIPRRTREGAL